MKKLITILMIFSVFGTVYAQTSGGPDAYGYRWKSSRDSVNPPVFKWFDITTIGTLVTGLGDDNFVGPFNASNGFQYYWYSTPQFYIGSNGYISFNGVNISSAFPASIPLPTGGNDFIAPLMSDLNFLGVNNPGRVYYYANTDTVCVSYINVPFWNLSSTFTGSNTFQIILNKVDKSITFNYRNTDMGLAGPGIDDLVGIENVTGVIGLGCLIDSLPPDSVTIKFTYPPIVTYQVKDVGINWNQNEQNGGIFLKKGGKPTPLMANVKNFGNQALSNITVYDTVYNLSGSAMTNGVAHIGSLLPGQDTTVLFSDSFSAPNKTTYTLNTRTVLTGDIVAANNSRILEMIAVDTTTAYMVLDYSDATANGTGLSWNGGGGGIGVYIEPPFYPARVKDTRFYHTSGGTPAAGFAAVIFDDDGPNGGPGTLLDSVFVTPGSFALNAYKSVNTANTVIIDSGGVYLYWAMGGPGIQLARDIDKPISLRTYEILGGSWSGYRDMNTEDFLIGMRVSFARPFADFIYNKTNDPSVSFTDKSTNDPTSWFWDFGDGNTDTLQNPTHVYLDNDTFTVCLTATNQYGSDSVCKTVIIDGVIPTADFRWDSTGTKTIIFFDKSTNDPTGWHWDFNVGPGDTANIQNTAYKYEANGMYNVCLIAKNKNGASAPACQTVEIIGIGINEMHGASIDVYPNPMADYTTVRLSPEIQSDQIKIKLLNVLGNEVSTRIQKNGNVYMIFRDQLVPGMYIIEISSADKVLTRMSLQVAE